MHADQPSARWAAASDVPELVRLRRVMFAAMGWDTTERSWEATARGVIAQELAADRLAAAVVDAPGSPGVLAASGIVQFSARLPAPGAPGGQRGYVLSMSTDPNWQRRGYARQVLALLLDECARRDVSVVELHATEAGRGLYESVGFQPATGSPEMRLRRG